jgi:hypothetical protein
MDDGRELKPLLPPSVWPLFSVAFGVTGANAAFEVMSAIS